jgi:hypothetical protein
MVMSSKRSKEALEVSTLTDTNYDLLVIGKNWPPALIWNTLRVEFFLVELINLA